MIQLFSPYSLHLNSACQRFVDVFTYTFATWTVSAMAWHYVFTLFHHFIHTFVHPFVCPFIQSAVLAMISHERLEEL